MKKYGFIGSFTLFAATFGMLFSVDNETVYRDGDYGVIEISGGKRVKFEGIVKVQNINVNGPGTITVTKGSVLHLSGSLHQNGSFNIYNYGTIKAGNFEAQNGGNYFYNEGAFTANIGQITDCSSLIDNLGDMQFVSFQANCGTIRIKDCARFTAGHLDINGKVFSGTGFLAAWNSINVNNIVSPPGLYFYAPRAIDGKYTNGLYIVTKDWSCEPLEVLYPSITFEGNTVSFEAINIKNIDHVLIEVSKDGQTWQVAKKVNDISEINHIQL